MLTKQAIFFADVGSPMPNNGGTWPSRHCLWIAESPPPLCAL